MSEASDTDSSLFSPLQGEEKRNLTHTTTSPTSPRPENDAGAGTTHADPASPLPQLLAEHLVTVKLQAEEKIHSLKHENRVLRQRLEVKTDENRVMKQKLHVRGSMNTDPTKRTLDFSNLDEDFELEEDERGDPTETDPEEDDPIAITWNLGNQEFSNGRYQDGVKHYTIAAKMLVSNLASAEAKVSRMSAELEETSAEKAAVEKEMLKMKNESEREETASRDRIAELEKDLEKQDELARENAEMLVAAQMKEEKLKRMEEMLEQLKADNFRLAELESQNRELEAELNGLQQRLETAETEKDGSLQRFETQQAEFTEQSGVLEAVKAQLESIQKEAEMAKIAQEEQQDLVDQLQKENMSLQEQAAHAEIEWSTKFDALEFSTKEDKDTLEEQEATITDLKAQRANAEQEVLNLRAEAADLGSQLSELRKENESLQAERSTQLDEYQAEKDIVTAENCRLQGAVSKVSEEMETLEEQYKRELKVKEDLSTILNDKLEETLAELSTLSSAKLSLEEDRERLMKDLQDQQASLELRSNSDSINAEKITALTEEKQRIDEEKDTLLKEKECLERSAAETKKELSERNDKFKKLAKKYKQLRDAKEEKPQEEETVKKELFEKVMESENDLKFIVEEQAARIEQLQAKLQQLSQAPVQSPTIQEFFPMPAEVSQQQPAAFATAPAEGTDPGNVEREGQSFPPQHTEAPAETLFTQDAPLNPSDSAYQQPQTIEAFEQPANDAVALFGADAPPAQGSMFAAQPVAEDTFQTTNGANAVSEQQGVNVSEGFEPAALTLFDSAPVESNTSMFERQPGVMEGVSDNRAETVFDAGGPGASAPPPATPGSQMEASTAEGFFTQEAPETPNSAFGSSNAVSPYGGAQPMSQDTGMCPPSDSVAVTAQATFGANSGYQQTQEESQNFPPAPPRTASDIQNAEQFFGHQSGMEETFGAFNTGGEMGTDAQSYTPSNAAALPQAEAVTAAEGPPAAADFFKSVPADTGAVGGELFEPAGLSSSATNQNREETTADADALFQQPPTSGLEAPSEPQQHAVQQPLPSQLDNQAGSTAAPVESLPTAAGFFHTNQAASINDVQQDVGFAPPAADGLFEGEQQTAGDLFAQSGPTQVESSAEVNTPQALTVDSSQFASETADHLFINSTVPLESTQPLFDTNASGETQQRRPPSPSEDTSGARSVILSELASLRDTDSLSVQASSVANVQEVQQVISEGDDTAYDQRSVSEAARSEADAASLPPSGHDARRLIRAMTAEDVEELNQAKADAADLSFQLQETQRELNEKQAELELALDGMSALKAENDSLTQRIEDGTKAEQEAEAERATLRQQLEQFEQQRSGLQHELDSTKTQAEALEREKTELESAISALNDELSSAHSVLGGLESNAKQERSEAQQEISSLQDQLKELSIEVDSKQGLLKTKEAELEEASRSLSEMESTIETYTSQLTENEEKLSKQLRETEYLNEQFQELQDLIVKEKEGKKKLQLELEQVQSEAQQRATIKVEETIELEELKSANDILQQEVESIKNREITRVAELEERQLYLQSQISSLESERVGLKNELDLVKSSRVDVEEKDKALLAVTSKWNKLLVVLKRMEYERDRALDEASTMYEFDLSGEIEQEVGKTPLRRIRKSPPQAQAQKPTGFEGFEDSNGTDVAIGGEPSEGWNKYIQNLTSEVDSYRIIHEGNGNGNNSNGFSPKGKLLSVNSASFEAEEKANAEELEALRAKCARLEAEAEQANQTLLTKARDCQDEVLQCMSVLDALQPVQPVQPEPQALQAEDLQDIASELEECIRLSDQTLENRGSSAVDSASNAVVLEEKTGGDEVICELSKEVEDCMTLAQKLEGKKIVTESTVVEQKEPDGYTEQVVNERDTALAELKSLRHQLALRKSIFGGKAPLQPRGSIVEDTMYLHANHSPSPPSRRVKISPRGFATRGTPTSASGALGRSILSSERLSTPGPMDINPDSPLVTPWSDKYWDNTAMESSLPPRPAKLDLDSLSPTAESEAIPSDNAIGTNALDPSMRDRSFRNSELPVKQPIPGEGDATGADSGGGSGTLKKRRSNSGKRFVSQMFGIHSKVEAEVSLSDNNSDFASEEDDPEEKPKPVTNVMSDPFTAARSTAVRSRSSTAQSYQHTSPRTSPVQYASAAPAPAPAPAPAVNLARPGSPQLENTPSTDYQTSWPIIDSSVTSSPPEIVGDPMDSMQTVGASSPFSSSPGLVDSKGLLWVAPTKEETETEVTDGEKQNEVVDASELQSQVVKLREENTKALSKVKELENQLEIERDARIWRERQHCVTETELERVIEANEELHERLMVLTTSLESAQEQLSSLSQADGGAQPARQDFNSAALEEELYNCKLEITSLRQQLESAEAQLEARRTQPPPPPPPPLIPVSSPPMETQGRPVEQAGQMQGADKALTELRALLTARELDIKNLTDQLSNKYYVGLAQGTVTHRPRKFRHRQGRGCLSFTRRFVMPNMLVVLLAIVAALGASSTEATVDVRPMPT